MSRVLDIAVIPGDGIGPEVTAEALRVLRAAVGDAADVRATEYTLGAAHFLATGEVLSDDSLAALKGHDAILFGAVGGDPRDERLAGGIIERGLLLKLRFAFDQSGVKAVQSGGTKHGRLSFDCRNEGDSCDDSADFLETIIAEDKSRALVRRVRWATYLAIALTAIAGLAIYGYFWTQSQFYVGADQDSVVIFRGVNGDVAGIPLHAVEKDTDIPLAKLPQYLQQAVKMTIPVESYDKALEVINRISNVSNTQ